MFPKITAGLPVLLFYIQNKLLCFEYNETYYKKYVYWHWKCWFEREVDENDTEYGCIYVHVHINSVLGKIL